jgi:hypothetical protein
MSPLKRSVLPLATKSNPQFPPPELIQSLAFMVLRLGGGMPPFLTSRIP